MEEADALSDRIALMNHGQVKCCGSPLFLKDRFGSGYRLTLSKDTTFNQYAMENLVERVTGRPVAADSNAVAVFGSVELDLRQAQIEAMSSEIRAVAVFGSVEITIPAGMRAEITGVGVFGDFSQAGEVSSPNPQLPTIRVSGLALFGSVSVKEKPSPGR